MRFIHLSDLHIGKTVNGFSMLEDQRYILDQILGIIKKENPDAVLIAGDIYDKSVPSAEAVSLLDSFLTELAETKTETFIISGNHDSAERTAFGSHIMDETGIHIAPVYDGNVLPHIMHDQYGEVCVYMLPFIKPVNVRQALFQGSDREGSAAQAAGPVSFNDALAAAVEAIAPDPKKRNILLTHQFITGAERSDSEEVSVGGTDNVDGSVFADFDYIAAGHLHRPQELMKGRIRYCGTPIAYSFSEAGDEKSVTAAELGSKQKNGKAQIGIRTIPLRPLRRMRVIRGKYDDLMARENYKDENTGDYVKAVLTDEEEIVNAFKRLQTVYPNIMKMEYDNIRTRSRAEAGAVKDIERKSPLQLFDELYEMQNGQPMDKEQRTFISDLVSRIWEEEE